MLADLDELAGGVVRTAFFELHSRPGFTAATDTAI
jgi:hypothetical protein